MQSFMATVDSAMYANHFFRCHGNLTQMSSKFSRKYGVVLFCLSLRRRVGAGGHHCRRRDVVPFPTWAINSRTASHEVSLDRIGMSSVWTSVAHLKSMLP